MNRIHAAVKREYPGHIVLLHAGSYYETFGADAAVVAEVCGVKLQGHDGAPFARLGFVTIRRRVDQLVAAGYKVAVCEMPQELAAKAMR